jgi:hypothetical protein
MLRLSLCLVLLVWLNWRSLEGRRRLVWEILRGLDVSGGAEAGVGLLEEPGGRAPDRLLDAGLDQPPLAPRLSRRQHNPVARAEVAAWLRQHAQRAFAAGHVIEHGDVQ